MNKRGQLQDPLDPIPQPLGNLPIIRFIPNTDNILTVPDRDHRSAYFRSGDPRELTSDEGQHDFFPVSGCQALLEPNDPFPPAGIGRIFPCGFNPLSEEMVIGGGGEIIRSDEEIVAGPEFFNGVDCRYLFDG